MELNILFSELIERQASDIHLVVGQPPVYRIDGALTRREGEALTEEDIRAILLPHLNEMQRAAVSERRLPVEFTLHAQDRNWRGQVFCERGRLGATLRPVPRSVPTLEMLGFGEDSILRTIIRSPRGLVIVTGPTGSGKTTTIAAMIETINATTPARIFTIEDPIEYEFESRQSVITQHQVGFDVESFRQGLLMAFRADLDVAYLGEVRDLETLQLTFTLAETGHLVLFTVHCENASQTVARLMDVFPAEQQGWVRRQLARNLVAIVAQRLLPRADRRGRVAANEILTATPRIRRMIAEGQTDLTIAIEAGRDQGMQTMDDAVLAHYRSGTISRETAWCNVENLERLGPQPEAAAGIAP